MLKFMLIVFVLLSPLACHSSVDKPTPIAPSTQMSDKKISPKEPKKKLKEELKKKTPEITPKKHCMNDDDCTVTSLTFRSGKTYCCHTCAQNPVSKTSLAEIAEYCRTLPRDLPCPEQNQCAQQDNGQLKCIAKRCEYTKRLENPERVQNAESPD